MNTQNMQWFRFCYCQGSSSFEKVFWNITCSSEDFILISQKNCVQNCPNVWFAFCILNKLCCSKVDSWLLPKITSWQGKSEEEEEEKEEQNEEAEINASSLLSMEKLHLHSEQWGNVFKIAPTSCWVLRSKILMQSFTVHSVQQHMIKILLNMWFR